MKIVFVLENYLPHIGGVEIVFKELAESLAKNHDIHIITHRLKATKKYEMLNGVHVHRISVPSFLSRYFFTFLALPRILRIAKDADIIHTTTYNGAPPARWASILLKKPSVITVHEALGNKWKTLGTMGNLSAVIHEFLEKRVLKLKFQKFVCVSRSTMKDLMHINPKADANVVYNGIDVNFWDPKKYSGISIRQRLHLKAKFICLFYGRPGITKGLEYLLQAFPTVVDQIPEAVLVCILSKDETYKGRYSEVRSLIKNLKIEDKIIILDPVPRSVLPNYIKMADCVVIPSLTEGFGFTTVESCMMQTPVVVSDTTSLPEVVFGNHVLVKPRNPKSIVEGIVRVFQNKTDFTPKKNFSIKKNVEGYLKVYEGLLKPKNAH